jgi:RNA polymerase sigma-70 factor (ECF subfamily)
MKLAAPDILALQTKVARQRDEPAYKTLFLYFHKPLLDLGHSYLRSRESAEEIVCDVLMKVWTMKEGLLAIHNLRFYLFQSVRNAAINELKKNKKYTSWDIETLDVQLDTNRYNPEDQLIRNELTHKIVSAIRQLPPKCQMVYKLVREEGFTYKEVAQLLDISPNTVDRHLNNALHKLVEAVKEYYPLP